MCFFIDDMGETGASIDKAGIDRYFCPTGTDTAAYFSALYHMRQHQDGVGG